VLLIRENFEAQSVVVSGSFAGGAIFEPAGQAGIAGLTAELTTRGTQQRSFDDLHETLESNGMSLGVDAGRHTTSFGGKALAEDLPTLLTLLGEVLRTPSLPEEHFALILDEAITGLEYYQQDTRHMANKVFRQLIYPADHIYSRSPEGELETVRALTIDHARAFHAAQYGPAKLRLAVVGAFKAADIIAEVERVFADWQNPQQQSDYSHPPIPALEGIRYQMVELSGKTQNDIVLGVPGPARQAEDYQAARLANNVLGVFGMMGRLGASVREQKGLAYYSYSGLDGGTDQGPWRVSAGVNPKNVKLAVDSIRLEIERMLNEPISPQDLADNQSYFIGRLPLLLESNNSVAGNLLMMEEFDLGLDYLKNYAQTMQSLTVEQAQAAFRHYWNPEAFSLVVAGPAITEAVV
jgi:zinc protease